MAPPSPASPQSGGVFVALGAIGGTAAGLLGGEPTMGFLIGLAGGVAAAVAIWLRSR